MAILVFSVTSICETGKERQDAMNAYNQFPDKKFLGAGGFGTVRLFPHDGKVYAVKKIVIKPSERYTKYIREQNSEGLRQVIDNINEELDDYYYFEDGFDKEDFNKHTSRAGLSEEHIEFVKKYVRHMKNKAEDVNTEMRLNRKLGTAQLDNPDRMKANFNFCIRDSGFVFYLFQDKYGEPLDSDGSKEYFELLSIKQRFNLYMLMLKRLKFIHDQGIVHCDIKGSNMLWADETHKDIVFVDYGLAVNGKDEMCSGGTHGYRAPEIVTDEEVADLEQNSFKADIYSLAALIAELESTRKYPENSFIYAKAKLEDKHTLMESYDDLMSKLEGWMGRVSKRYESAFPDLKQNYIYFYGLISKVLRALLDPDYTQRPNLSTAYMHIWHLYQLSRMTKAAPQDFESFVQSLKQYLETYQNQDDYFTLPEDPPIAKAPVAGSTNLKAAGKKAKDII